MPLTSRLDGGLVSALVEPERPAGVEQAGQGVQGLRRRQVHLVARGGPN